MKELKEFPMRAAFKEGYKAEQAFYSMLRVRNIEPFYFKNGELKFSFSAFGITAKKSAERIAKRHGGSLNCHLAEPKSVL